MACGELGEVAIDAGLVALFGEASGVEEQIGDLRHGGHDCGDGSRGGVGSDQVAGGFHAGGGADAGASEFHD